jgi:hypothetical protein
LTSLQIETGPDVIKAQYPAPARLVYALLLRQRSGIILLPRWLALFGCILAVTPTLPVRVRR